MRDAHPSCPGASGPFKACRPLPSGADSSAALESVKRLRNANCVRWHGLTREKYFHFRRHRRCLRRPPVVKTHSALEEGQLMDIETSRRECATRWIFLTRKTFMQLGGHVRRIRQCSACPEEPGSDAGPRRREPGRARPSGHSLRRRAVTAGMSSADHGCRKIGERTRLTSPQDGKSAAVRRERRTITRVPR